MNKTVIRLMPLIGLSGLLALATGCGSSGLDNITGANLKLEGLTLGNVTMEGKSVEGIPSQNINLVLDVDARTLVLTSTEDGIILIAEPSEATVTITKDGVNIEGLDSDQIKVEWQSEED